MYTVATRTCAVKIFKSLLKAIDQNMPNKEEKAKLLNPVLPVFINKLISALGTPSGQHTSFALKTEIIKGNHCLTIEQFLLNSSKNLMNTFISSFNLHGE